jgi:type III secretion system FlhB-like substrate exporter
MTQVDKFKKVVGIQYEPGEGLPRVIVKGSGRVAEEIVKNAPLQGGPKVFENRQLVDRLYRLPIDAEISQDTFQLVAILLTHVFSIEEKLKKINE